MAQWAAILGGGDGSRLKDVTRGVEGDDRPKQFCRLLGAQTLLDDTRGRVAANVSAERTVLVLTARHRPYYQDLASRLPPHLLIEQPSNRSTAPAIAYAVGRVMRLDSSAVLAVMPSDHHYLEPSVVRDALDVAMGTARLHQRHLVLMGAAAERAESEYGWIVPGPARAASDRFPVFGVDRFCEKPGTHLANALWSSGCLWNTFITVGTVRAFLESLRRTTPALHEFAQAIADARDAAEEAALAAAFYAMTPPTCFSTAVLAAAPELSLVVRMTGAGWLDVGHPERLAVARQHLGYVGAASRAS
jgi:mannose-1-phosphate guanylyltransferase